MSSMIAPDWQLAVAGRDEPAVHELLLASDLAAAARSGTQPPRRRPEATEHLVASGSVHLARAAGVPVATVTAGPQPSFDPAGRGLAAASRPWYMQRLAVHPDAGPLVGTQAVRRAISAARAAGADALRAEANPDLADVLALLALHGFRRGATDDTGSARRTFLQLNLEPDLRPDLPPELQSEPGQESRP